MGLKKEVEAVLNKQVEQEFDAAVVYYGMYIYFEQELLKGFAAWFKHQMGEEMSHVAKLIEYMIERGGSPVVPATKAPRMKYASSLDALKSALAHEHANTAGIHACLKVAAKADDPATLEMLQWFVKEQVEEEEHASDILNQIRIIGDIPGHLFYLDHHLAKRE